MSICRFWFEFDITMDDNPPPGTLVGCGVSAYDRDDALDQLKTKVFVDQPIPNIRREMVDVDVSELDQNHVLPNMGLVAKRGIWFPLGFE